MRPYELRGTWINLDDVACCGPIVIGKFKITSAEGEERSTVGKMFEVAFKFGAPKLRFGVPGVFYGDEMKVDTRELTELTAAREQLLSAWLGPH